MSLQDLKQELKRASDPTQRGFAVLGAALVGALVAGLFTFWIAETRFQEAEAEWKSIWYCTEEKRWLEGIDDDLRSEVAYSASAVKLPEPIEADEYQSPVKPSQIGSAAQPAPAPPSPAPEAWTLRIRSSDYQMAPYVDTDSKVLRSYVASVKRMQELCGIPLPDGKVEVWGDMRITDLTESKLTEFAVEVSHVRRS